jgi:miniconductance mechanosensitive channel
VNCIHFCTDKEIDLYKKEPLLINFFETASLDGLTNLTIYRAYIEEYLQKNEKINTNMLLVVRYLQPGEHGLPLEVFCYTKAKDLLNHEKAQSEIFDHIYAVAGRFNVKFFQKFTGESKE